jgi:1-acyl-sn-glycerol-3-phosphate acyltransferase
MKRVFLVVGIVAIYVYLYLALVFNLFYSTPAQMRLAWYTHYGKFIAFVARKTGLTKKIKIAGETTIEKNKKGVLLLNHSSVVDNLIVALLLNQNEMNWNDMRTISRISRKTVQNKVLRLFDSLLVNKDIYHDMAEFNRVLPKWQAAGPVQIILYPEGTIFMPETGIAPAQTRFLNSIQVKPYTQVLFPNNGIFELLIDRVKPDYVYDISIMYTLKGLKGLKGQRLCGEKDILSNLHRDEFNIQVYITKYAPDAIHPNWLYRLWEKKDARLSKNFLI